ncbi:Trm112 family protein [Roseiarcaceae bacterium H3SJ34-1]|uniref:Trm112 family protein n=1 Tax=Terripilifer ovatus TaxID=3032367 RepID=UPI003AB999D8|nr:Trm112 family protein [Roseiarcaceae bacterium H3SJ34-1]
MSEAQERHAEEPQPQSTGENTKIDPRLLEILVCPITRTPLTYDSAAQELISESTHYAYAIRDGIPIMILDEARQVET